MTEKHPGGLSMTRHLLELSQLSPCRILDMGAGDGHGVRLLQELGFDAIGIDLVWRSADDLPPGHFPDDAKTLPASGLFPDDASNSEVSQIHNLPVIRGDFVHCPFPDCSFDAVLSECSFYVSGNPEGAMQEAARLLKRNGTLLLADVSFMDPELHRQTLERAEFSIKCMEDITPLWKEYYISCIWNGTAEEFCGDMQKNNRKKCFYYLTICERM